LFVISPEFLHIAGEELMVKFTAKFLQVLHPALWVFAAGFKLANLKSGYV